MIVSVICAFILNLIFTPIIIALCKKYDWYDSVNPRKMHDGDVSRLGGVGILLSCTIAFTVYIIFYSGRQYTDIIPVFAAMIIVFFEGLSDDLYELHARTKFFVQVAAALTVALGPIYFKTLFVFSVPEIVGRAMTFIWIIALVNAYNLIDGLDMLCGGLTFLTHLTLGLLMYFCDVQSCTLCFIFCASIAAFLLFNKTPAKIFLGDGGSQFLGFSIALIPLLYDFGDFEDVKAATMGVLVSIPATDVLAAIWRRKREHRSFFTSDRAHIHHKFINIGFSSTVTVLFILLIQLIVCIAVIGVLFMDSFKQRITIHVVAIMFVWLIFVVIHYVNRAVNRKLKGHLSEAPQKLR